MQLCMYTKHSVITIYDSHTNCWTAIPTVTVGEASSRPHCVVKCVVREVSIVICTDYRNQL